MFVGAWCNVCDCYLPKNRSGHVTRSVKRIHCEGAKHTSYENRQANIRNAEIETMRKDAERRRNEEKNERLCLLALAVASHRLSREYGSIEAARETACVIAESVVMDMQLRPNSVCLAKLIASKMMLNAANSAYDVVTLVKPWVF